MNQDYCLNELLKFILLIPEDVLLECVNNINFANRIDRRKVEKTKALEGKIKEIINNMPYRVQLIENIYEKYDVAQNIDDSMPYEDIISSINADNCIPQIIYTLHRCCDDDFDKQHFNDFILSVPFQKTINHKWEKTENNNLQKVNDVDVSSNENREEISMKCYLGYIELRNTFYNFKPQFTYDGTTGNVKEISYDLLREYFPEYGTVNLGYRFPRDDAKNFLDSLKISKTDDFINLYAIYFDENELEDTGDDRTKKKIDLQKLYENGVDLKNRIKPISSLKFYKIVTPQKKVTNESFLDQIFINEKNCPANEDVLLEVWSEDDKCRLFGPYKLQERYIDGEKYVLPNSSLQKYVLDYYDESDYDVHTFEKHRYMDTDVAQINGSPRSCDVIPDSILLAKLTDSIDMSLLSSNPEEFQRLYSTSPFLADIPKEIRDDRIAKIQSILQNTSDYGEIIRNTFDSLINSDNFTIPEETIKKSQIYKDLEKERTNLEAELDELKKCQRPDDSEKEKYEQEISELNDQLENYEKEIKELKEKLSLPEKYEELKKKYEEEREHYDTKVLEVKSKNEELKNIQEKIESFITNELKKPDTTQMLRTAFDPYISSAMIDAASNYRDSNESEQYKIIAEEMKNYPCSEFDKNKLIESLVAGVQKFRNYSKNEIINMYICLTQNFLTIFSGEPGTGKTSICSILANSMGLNKFENSDEISNNVSKNRFIPVSVERGWSSKRDLIGYYNPLTKKYDRSNAKIYDALMILNEERKNSRFPYLILLDEANLSPIEYYWADFMRATDSDESNIFINIGLDKDIYIPKTLHFLATINNDQTTEELSPRLIDRAWIIKLPTPKGIIAEPTINAESYFEKPILWSDIEKAFATSESKEMSLKAVAEDIYNLFGKHHLPISPRVQQSIKNYVCVAQEIMEDDGDCKKRKKLLILQLFKSFCLK